MNNRATEVSQGDGGKPPPQTTAAVTNEQLRSRAGNKVYKSGPLFLSSKGIGWTSWKKRWFILTRTSLVFYRSDPSVIPQKGAEVNLPLGGIDLNSSGSVVVKADKKLLTVLFPDGRDGRAFTLKAETMEDLFEWKTALEDALANAPSPALAMGQNGIFNNQADGTNGSSDQTKYRQPPKSFVIGRPILLALEEIDGTPSFLEKALRFLEEHGVKSEGILRQAAAVDDVEHRVQEYEQGNQEFSPDEDAHVVADCIKFFLRELPSSPVPASCCKALLEAYRADRSMKVTAMRTAICETFPEPNRRLLQRILMMMQSVVAHKAETRMGTSAVAACMAPLLLRPLLAGECDLGGDFDMPGGGDGSFQLLQAAAAANHAQAIVIMLLEEYKSLFGEGSMSPELYSDSEDDGSESEEISDDYETYEDDDEYYDETEGSGEEDYDDDHSSRGAHSNAGENDKRHHKGLESSKVAEVDKNLEPNQKVPTNAKASSGKNESNVEGNIKVQTRSSDMVAHDSKSSKALSRDDSKQLSIKKQERNARINDKSINISDEASSHARQQTGWGRTPGVRNVPGDVDPEEEEAEIQKLEAMKGDLEIKVAEEVQINRTLQGDLDKRRNALNERRQALEKEVKKLQKELKKEKELRLALEAGLRFTLGTLSSPPSLDENPQLRAEIDEIVQQEAEVNKLKQKADDLGIQISQQREQNDSFTSLNDAQQARNQQGKPKDKQKESDATRPADRLAKKKADLAKSLRQLPQNPQLDLARISKSVSTGATNLISPDSSKSQAATNKKSGTRNEGATNSTTSALSKLTNRLNFLKERRTQLEQQKHDQRGGKESETSPQSYLKESESSSQSSERGRIGADASFLTDNRLMDSSLHNQDKYKKQESQQNIDNKGKRNDTHSSTNLDRDRSESFCATDKGRSANTGSSTGTRTNSR